MRVKQQCLDASAHATNTPIFGKLNPDQNPTDPLCPKSMSAIAVSSTAATHTSSVPSTPQAPTPTLAPTFKKTLMPNPMNFGNPKVRAITTAN